MQVTGFNGGHHILGRNLEELSGFSGGHDVGHHGCASGGCSTLGLAGLAEGLAEHIADAHPSADPGGQACAAGRVLGGVSHGICCLELGVGLHVEHTHRPQFLGGFIRGFQVANVERLQGQANRPEVILSFGAHASRELIRQADQLKYVALGGSLAQQVLQFRQQHHPQAVLDIAGAVVALRTDDLGHKLLRVSHLEAVGAEALQQGDAQSNAGVAHDDRLGGAPFLIGKLAHRDIEHLGSKGCPVPEGFPDQVNQ